MRDLYTDREAGKQRGKTTMAGEDLPAKVAEVVGSSELETGGIPVLHVRTRIPLGKMNAVTGVRPLRQTTQEGTRRFSNGRDDCGGRGRHDLGSYWG